MPFYSAAIPALLPLASGQYDSPAPAIEKGDLHCDVHILAAKKQLKARENIADTNPKLITDAELVAAERRFHRIQTAQFVDFASNQDAAAAAAAADDDDDDSIPPPRWAKTILDRLDVDKQHWQEKHDGIEVKFETLSRQLLQESQRSANRSVRRNKDPLVPVLRMEDGQVPPFFPATTEEFVTAPIQQLDALLQFYHLDPNGTREERRKRLRDPLGLTM